MMTEFPPEDYLHATARTPEGVVFAARQTGLYRSDDHGHTWQPAYATLNLEQALPTTAVAVGPDFDQSGLVFAGVAGGVLASRRGGERWEFHPFPQPEPVITALAVSPNFNQDRTLLAGTLEDGIFLSHDGGHTWQAWNFGLLDWCVYALAFSPDYAADRTVLAGTETGLWRSQTGGRSWQALPFPPEAPPVTALELPAGADPPGLIRIETENQGRYRSNDGGATWIQEEQNP